VISYIAALLFLGVILYMAIIYESIALAMVGFSLAVLAAASLVYLLIERARIRVDISIPITLATQNRPFYVRLEEKGSTHLLHPGVRAKLTYGDELATARKSEYIFLSHTGRGRKKKRERACDCRVVITEPGSYVFKLESIRLYDWSGLFYLNRRVGAEAHALVLPTPQAIGIVLGDRVRNFFGDADTFDDLRPGYDPSETFDIREFRDGDRMQSVHWKMTAKTDNLMVKENSLPKACPVVLFVTPQADRWKKQLAMLASLSYSLMDAGCPHFVTWDSKVQNDLIRTRVDDEESYYICLTTLMQDISTEKGGDICEEYRRKYRGEFYLHGLSVSGDGTLMMDGEPAIEQLDTETELSIL